MSNEAIREITDGLLYSLGQAVTKRREILFQTPSQIDLMGEKALKDEVLLFELLNIGSGALLLKNILKYFQLTEAVANKKDCLEFEYIFEECQEWVFPI